MRKNCHTSFLSALALGMAASFLTGTPIQAAAVDADEAESIAVDAYVYFYPLVSMEITRRQLTNVTSSVGIASPMNTFSNVREYPPADMKAVVRPNFDTLYSSAWLDLTKEPVVVSVPDTGGRFYLLPMLDMWSDVFASPGHRTTGTGAAEFLLTPPDWTGEVPAGCTHIPAPTPYVWIIGRTKTDGPSDYPAVHKIQDGYQITPLSSRGKSTPPVVGKIDAEVDMKTPPKTQVDTMTGEKYFALSAEIMKLNPPHITDQAIVSRMKRIGIEPGKSFDPAKMDPVIRKAVAAAPA